MTSRIPKPKLPGKLRQNFIAGLVVIVPIVATVWVVKWLFELIDGILAPAFEPIFGREIPGFGFIAIIILVYLTGLLVTNVIGNRLIQFGHTIVEKVPLVSQIYHAFRQIMDSLMMSQKGAFKEVVLVEFPREGMRTVAFVTSKVADKNGNELLNLFIPTVPNPTSGFYQVASPEKVIRTDMSVEDAMKIVLSAGMISPAVIDWNNSVSSEMSKDINNV